MEDQDHFLKTYSRVNILQDQGIGYATSLSTTAAKNNKHEHSFSLNALISYRSVVIIMVCLLGVSSYACIRHDNCYGSLGTCLLQSLHSGT